MYQPWSIALVFIRIAEFCINHFTNHRLIINIKSEVEKLFKIITIVTLKVTFYHNVKRQSH